MNRRSFLKAAGAASLAAGLSTPARIARAEQGAPGAMRIDPNKVDNRNQNRSTVACRNGIVCTSQPLASICAMDILKAGGNAVDAAVCANAILGLTEPMNCGPGGDLFAILWIEKDRRLYGLNASGRSPYDWNLDEARKRGLDKEIPPFSALAWNVPGCVSGWGALLERFGSRSFADVLAPAIAYARDGFPVAEIAARDWDFDTADASQSLKDTFAPGGRPPRFGDIFQNPDYADTLDKIAQGGADAFYKGEIAERIVKAAQENGSLMSMRDLADHSATWVDPATTSYRGYDVWEIPPNGQGISVLQILNMLETFDIGSLEPNSAEHLHLFIEAKKLAFEDRAVYYADPEKADVPIDWLISKDYGRERAKLIDPRRASDRVNPGQVKSDTVYLTAADREGNMISLIQSIYYGWGSHIVPGNLGFSMQNRGRSFALDPNHRNRLEGHKRPFHTIIPAFVTRDGQPVFSFGVMGGDFQPQGHSQVLMNLIDFHMAPQQAGDQPRIEHSGSSGPTGEKMEAGGSIKFEHGFPDDVRLKLAEMGHRIRPGVDSFGGYQGIWREENPRRYFGGSDPRKDGMAIGY